MAKFRFPQPNYTLMLAGGKTWTNGFAMCAEVPEGAVCDALRRTTAVEEVGSLPPEAMRRYLDCSNDGAHYPLPDFASGKPVVIVGRGASSEKFWERFPASDYIRIGINPGSYPFNTANLTPEQQNAQGDGRHVNCLYDFDCVMSVDVHYLSGNRSPFLMHYKGPVATLGIMEYAYKGPGTLHDVSELYGQASAGLSFEFVVKLLARLGVKDTILCGVDCHGGDYYQHRATVVLHVQWARAKGMRVWREAHTPFVEIGEVWNGPVAS